MAWNGEDSPRVGPDLDSLDCGSQHSGSLDAVSGLILAHPFGSRHTTKHPPTLTWPWASVMLDFAALHPYHWPSGSPKNDKTPWQEHIPATVFHRPYKKAVVKPRHTRHGTRHRWQTTN